MADYLRAASGVEEDRWRVPVQPGKWTPAQITEHLLRTYRTVLDQARGGPGIRTRVGPVLRLILRVVLLPWIFRTRRLPAGAKAPSEIRPSDSDTAREDALRQLQTLSDDFEAEILARRHEKDLRLTHHVFGAIEPLRGIDFVAIHTEHHGRQLPRS